jgi:iron-sulfur cluster repair protein YtfE (RIC family)
MAVHSMIDTTLRETIETQPIRVLVEDYPAVMPVLGQYGMDLCCGGGHTVPEAAHLHDLDLDMLVRQMAAAILHSRQ